MLHLPNNLEILINGKTCLHWLSFIKNLSLLQFLGEKRPSLESSLASSALSSKAASGKSYKLFSQRSTWTDTTDHRYYIFIYLLTITFP